jgi:hypothetical protein
MYGLSEEQWEVVDYCADCGESLYRMGDSYRWGSTYCQGVTEHITTEADRRFDVDPI